MDLDLVAVAVDDEPVTLALIDEIALEAGISVVGFASPEEALPYIEDNEIDMVFTDYRMQQMDGIEFTRELRKKKSDIPIVMVTAFSDYSLMVEAIKAGATEFITKPINSMEFLARIRNLAQLRIAQILLRDRAKQLDVEIRREIEKITSREQEAILVLGRALENAGSGDDVHDLRVARYSKMIARSAGADSESQEKIFYASLFHDIGKVSVSHDVLLKEGELSAEEREIIKSHASMGSSILDNAHNEYLREGGLVALTHHERFDGSGYPRGLKSDQIPFCGRVVAIADVFDSLTSKKSYRNAWTFDKAVDYIREKRGTYFDPFLVDAFLRSIDEAREIHLVRSRN